MADQQSRLHDTASDRSGAVDSQESDAPDTDGRGLPASRVGWGRHRPDGAQIFFGVLTLILFGYTVMAFSLAWDTMAGQIGPGFFPRIIGVLGTVLALTSLLRSVKKPASGNTASMMATDQEDATKHPLLIAVIAVSLGVFVTIFVPLGAPLTAFAFLAVMFFMIDRKHFGRRVVLSLVFPLFLFFLFDSWLNAGLPEGILTFL